MSYLSELEGVFNDRSHSLEKKEQVQSQCEGGEQGSGTRDREAAQISKLFLRLNVTVIKPRI